jgi:hypothetical protein
MLSVGEFSLGESNHIPSIVLTYDPPPEPQTPKEQVIFPSEFPIEFKDHGNTLKIPRHEELAHPRVVSPKILPKEWLMEVEHSSEAIQILSPSTTIPCSLRETNLEALHNPTVGTSIMSKFLAKHLLGNMPLVSTNKLFKSPLGLFFKCYGIARVMPGLIDKVKVHLDFHIYAILEFDLLIGHPLKNLILDKPSHGGLDEKFGETTFSTPTFCLESPKVKQQPNNNTFEEAKFISPFVSKLAYETEHIPSPSLEPKSCPSSHPNVVLNNDRDSKLILHERFCAMDMLIAPTLEIKEKDSIIEHESFSFETPMFHAHFWSLQGSLCLVPCAPTRIATTSYSSFPNFLGRRLWMPTFITNIADLVDAL